MNHAAYVIQENIVPKVLIEDTLARLEKHDWKSVWSDKRYAGEHWLTCPLIDNFAPTAFYKQYPICEKISSELKCKIKNLMFYRMLPGGSIPPHRDMVGNVGLGGLRIHVPLITNDQVKFIVNGELVKMTVGDLWGLDTSYLHSLSNEGKEHRIHLVADVVVNDWLKERLPKPNLQFYFHQLTLMWLGVLRGFHYLTRKDLKIADFVSVLKLALKTRFAKKS